LPLENLFLANLSRNHIENKFSILEIYLQCDFIKPFMYDPSLSMNELYSFSFDNVLFYVSPF
jgi:hypothetical protein